MTNTLYHGDAISTLETFPKHSIDLLLSDPPYAITANHWDNKINWDIFWRAASNVVKPTGAIILFGNPPFSFTLISNPIALRLYRYDWIWEKERGSNFQHANKQPMKVHEHIHVFYKKQPTYNPIKTDLDKVLIVKPKQRKKKTDGLVESSAATYHPGGTYIGKFPTSIIKFSRDRPMIHPTQKPLDLCKYLITTYSNIGDVVCDPFMGYGSVPLAAKELQRQYIGIELDQDWFMKAKTRIENK